MKPQSPKHTLVEIIPCREMPDNKGLAISKFLHDKIIRGDELTEEDLKQGVIIENIGNN